MFWLIFGLVAVGAIAVGASKSASAAPNAPPLPYKVGWFVRLSKIYDISTNPPSAQSATDQAGPNTFWAVQVTALPGTGTLNGLYQLVNGTYQYTKTPQSMPVTFDVGDIAASSPTA